MNLQYRLFESILGLNWNKNLHISSAVKIFTCILPAPQKKGYIMMTI